MPGKSVRVNNPEVAREHVTYGESKGGQSGKLTALARSYQAGRQRQRQGRMLAFVSTHCRSVRMQQVCCSQPY